MFAGIKPSTFVKVFIKEKPARRACTVARRETAGLCRADKADIYRNAAGVQGLCCDCVSFFGLVEAAPLVTKCP